MIVRHGPFPAPAPPADAGGCAGAVRSRRTAFRETARARSGSGPTRAGTRSPRPASASSSAPAQASSSSSSISRASRPASKARPIMAAQVSTWFVRGDSRLRRRPITSLMPSGMRRDVSAARRRRRAPLAKCPARPPGSAAASSPPTNSGLPSVWLWIASDQRRRNRAAAGQPIMRRGLLAAQAGQAQALESRAGATVRPACPTADAGATAPCRGT